MKKFNKNYILLEEMYQDEYYPNFLVDKIKVLVEQVIGCLESGETDIDKIQQRLDEMTIGINNLQEEFDENDSEIETVARDCIAVTVEYILDWFNVDIDIEMAFAERDW